MTNEGQRASSRPAGLAFQAGRQAVDPNALFAPIPQSAPPPQRADAQGKRAQKRARTADGHSAASGPAANIDDRSEIRTYRSEMKATANARKKHLSHLHDKQDPEELKRTVFVGNLPNDCSVKQLKKLFVACGDVESARIRTQMLDNTIDLKGKDRGRGVRILRGEVAKDSAASAAGFVVFRDAKSVDAALRLTGTVQLGHHIYVSREDDQSKAFDPQNSAYLGNLAYDVSDEEVWRFFAENGLHDVTKVRIIRDRTTALGKGFGYVSFLTPTSTNRAIQVCRGLPLHDRELRICHVQRSKDPKVRVLSRRELRREAERLAPKSGPQHEGENEKAEVKRRDVDGQMKTSVKRQAAADAGANPSWMGLATNPRKKLARDLRPLIPVSPAEAKARAKKKPPPARGAKKGQPPRKPAAK